MRNPFAAQKFTATISWVQVVALLLMSLLPLLASADRVSAYSGATLDNRSIQMSSPIPDDTGVVYEVEFDIATNHTPASYVLVACNSASTPIIGDSSCTAPAGFDWADATTENEDINAAPGGAATTDATASDAQYLVADVDSPAARTAGDTVRFELNGVTNQTATGTFYVRILTFTSSANADSYTAGTDTNATDVGGIALSTVDEVVITAKVQESLTFTVNQTAVALGDANGVLSSSTEYTDSSTQLSLATNAQGGVDVVATADGTLTSGANTIDAIGASCTGGSTGTEQFGFRVDDSGSSAITASAPYNCAAGSYGFDTSALAVGTGGAGDTTFGDVIATTAGATATDTADVEFVGNISNTTEAGIYTSTMTFTATGTF